MAEEDYEANANAAAEAQVVAVREVHDALGVPGVFALAEAAEHPEVLGRVIGRIGGIAEALNAVLLGELASPVPAHRDLAAGYVARRVFEAAWPWVDTVLADPTLTLSDAQWAELFLNLPATGANWDRLDQRSPEAVGQYWARFTPLVHKGPTTSGRTRS